MIDELAQTYAHYVALRRELSLWVEQSIRRDGPDQNQGGEDEANFALAFFQHYLVSGDERIAVRFRSLANDLKAWVRAECLHGYEPEAEAHHGTEPFFVVSAPLSGTLSQRQTSRRPARRRSAPHRQLDRGCARLVRLDARCLFELLDRHADPSVGRTAIASWPSTSAFCTLRWPPIASRARRATATGHCAMGASGPSGCWRWTDGCPCCWDLDGRGLQPEDLQTRAEQGMAGDNHHIADDPLAGIENLLASGAVYALGDLFLLEGDEIFRRAAKRIVEPLIGQLLDPYADPAAAALSYYRHTFADSSLDDAMCAVLARQPAESESPWAMVFPQERKRREPGVGKRSDMIYWGHWAEDGSVQPSREPRYGVVGAGVSIDGRADHGPTSAGGSSSQIRHGAAGVARRARARRYGRSDLLGGRGAWSQLGLRGGDGLLRTAVDGHVRSTRRGGAAGRVG